MKDTEFKTAVTSANMQGRIALAREILALDPAQLQDNEEE